MSPDIARYDRKALLVGQSILAETGAKDVILFGSRARGDYRKDSDIDLLVIHSGPKDSRKRTEAKESAKAAAAALYERPVGVDLVWFTSKDFDKMRHSHNHLTAIAAGEGINVDGEPANVRHSNDEGDYSYEWTLTSQRCRHARAHLRSMRRSIEGQEIDIIIGQHAQQALEHAMKALISASGNRYQRLHDLLLLEQDMRRADDGFPFVPASPLNQLNDYGGSDRYQEPDEPLGDLSQLYREVESDVRRIFQRISELTGIDPWQDRT